MTMRSLVTADRETDPYSEDEIVSHYEEMARERHLFGAEETVFDRYFDEPDSRVLDLGCGVGRTAVALHERGFDVVATDVSAEMVERGKSLFDDLEFQVSDATNLPFENDSFDYVLFAYGGLDAIRPEECRTRALKEMRRVCKPGGIVAFSSHNSLYRYISLVYSPMYFANYHLLHGNLRNIGRRYKLSAYDTGVWWHFSTPVKQVRELRSLDLEVLDIVGVRDSVLRYFESQPYYVAKHPQ